jgi:hypothetical protein
VYLMVDVCGSPNCLEPHLGCVSRWLNFDSLEWYSCSMNWSLESKYKCKA